jgi:hypothetical protein
LTWSSLIWRWSSSSLSCLSWSVLLPKLPSTRRCQIKNQRKSR